MNDDPTKPIDEQVTPPTQPTIDTVLERINAVAENVSALAGNLSALAENVSAIAENLSRQISEMRAEMLERFSRLDKKIDILNHELLEVKAEQARHGERITDLERKAS